MQNFNIETALLDLEAARGKVATAGNVGIVGFCLGGSLSWLAATRLKGFSGASSFYGGMVQQFATEVPKCPVQFHFGADDASIPPTIMRTSKNSILQLSFIFTKTLAMGSTATNATAMPLNQRLLRGPEH